MIMKPATAPFLFASSSILALLATSAVAAPWTVGDLLMGFVAEAGQGANETLVVNLGAAASFRDRFDTNSPRLNFKNIGTQLAAQFSTPGLNWYERTDLRVNLYGSTAADTIGDDLLNLDPFTTIYVARARAAVTTAPLANSQNVTGAGAQQTATSRIVSTCQAYSSPSVTADAAGVAIMPDSLANTIDEFTRPAAAAAFGAFSNGTDQVFSLGNRGSLPAVGDLEAILDFYRIQGRNDVSGQYGSGNPVRQGVYKGTFTLTSSGSISYNVVATTTAASGFSTWAVSKGLPANLADADDRDVDGIPALVEYALDLNPNASSTLPAPVPVAGGLQLAYPKGTAAAADSKITYQIESSSTLSGWANLAPASNNSTQISALLPANDPSGRLFGRLKVNRAN
jgi:hypothetical protein